MIWYKAWIESRMRFLIGAIAIAMLSAPWILFQAEVLSHYHPSPQRTISYYEYVRNTIYAPHVSFFFLLFAMLLGLGGLSRERTQGTAPFTLALPVSRFQLVASRASAGLFEIAALVLVQICIATGLSALSGHSYACSQALQFGLLWFACGSIWFSIAFLLSIFSGEYAASGACIAAFFIYTAITNSPLKLPAYLNVPLMMNGYSEGMDIGGWQISLTGTSALQIIAGYLLTAIGFLVASIVITQRQDF